MIAGLPDPLPADAEERLQVVSAVMIERIAAAIPLFIEGSVARIVDAWGRLDDPARAQAAEDAARAVPTVAAAITATLAAELARPAAEQRHTPLELLSTVVTAPTAILENLGIPPVVRDPRDEAIHPADIYDLTPRSLADLGDPELGPLQLAWGLAKHEAMRASRA